MRTAPSISSPSSFSMWKNVGAKPRFAVLREIGVEEKGFCSEFILNLLWISPAAYLPLDWSNSEVGLFLGLLSLATLTLIININNSWHWWRYSGQQDGSLLLHVIFQQQFCGEPGWQCQPKKIILYLNSSLMDLLELFNLMNLPGDYGKVESYTDCGQHQEGGVQSVWLSEVFEGFFKAWSLILEETSVKSHNWLKLKSYQSQKAKKEVKLSLCYVALALSQLHGWCSEV